VPSLERRTSDDRRADRQTSAASSRWSRPLPPRLIGGSADTTARTAGESSSFPIGSPSVSLDRQWRDRHRLGRFIEDEFQPADVAAVDSMSFWHIAIVADLRLARWTLPWWRRRTAREEIAVTRPLNHARGWSNFLAASRPRNHVHFAAAVSFFRALRCPMARQPRSLNYYCCRRNPMRRRRRVHTQASHRDPFKRRNSLGGRWVTALARPPSTKLAASAVRPIDG
jgi:hypothetical protein